MNIYNIQSNVPNKGYIDATIEACARAARFKLSVAVFQDRQKELHIQNVSPKSLKYFGRNGLLFVAGA